MVAATLIVMRLLTVLGRTCVDHILISADARATVPLWSTSHVLRHMRVYVHTEFEAREELNDRKRVRLSLINDPA